MKAQQVLKTLEEIINQTGWENLLHVAMNPHEEGTFWIQNGYLMYFSQKTFHCDDIINITYSNMECDEDDEIFTIFIESNDCYFCINAHNDMTNFIKLKKNTECLTNDDITSYFESYHHVQEMRNILYSRLNCSIFGYDDNENYLQIWNDETQKYLTEHNDDKKLKYAYADVAFVNDESGFSKDIALSYVGKNILDYIKHLEEDLLCDMEEEKDIQQCVAEVYEYYQKFIG